MPLTEPQQRILARKLALHRAAFGPVTDGRRLVDEAWGEAQTPEELRQITALMHYAVEYGVVAELRDIARALVRESDALACSLEQMERQRDALLAALRSIDMEASCTVREGDTRFLIVANIARAAIAAARGEG